ncbi:hypothetical protein [Paenibacillus gallinarum]|uniref:Transposase n=1 Tax=Paenibacillus gallinarum TaxID=2762232 RepID=A0ABR8SUL5_9BACL|nr:hypothetical protein [Paenibacillus gallinarum]MBD7967201.1 hypothetical protein [Paenibacillus gallinarum]
MLAMVGVPRASYYKWRSSRLNRSPKAGLDQEIKQHMMATHLAHPYFAILEW